MATVQEILSQYYVNEGVSLGSSQVLDKEAFLKLFLAQIEHQDPLNPLDTDELTSQLAQFSQVEQLVNLSEEAEGIKELVSSSLFTAAVSLIGKEVKAQGEKVYLQGDGATAIRMEVPQGTERVTITIYNEALQRVRTVVLRPESTELTYRWDGKGDSGMAMPDGLYYFQVEGVDGAGNPVGVNAYVEGKVTGIEGAGGDYYALLEGLPVPLSSILSVREP